jgi:V/A-type H+-transporting ATPase subunit D
MSLLAHTAPTRHALLQTRRRLQRVDKGVELLRRKRQALVVELFRLARPAAGAREEILAQAAIAYAALIEALAAHGDTSLHAMGWPTRHIDVTLRAGNVWGIPTAEVSLSAPVARSLVARGTAPPLTGPATLETATGFERLIELLLEAASREMLVRRLGDALTRASRQLHVLDQRLKPELSARIARVQQVLEEREREDHARLRRLAHRR